MMSEKEMMEKGIKPLPRDTSRFKKPSADELVVLPQGLAGQLLLLSTIELINDRHRAEK